MLQAYVTDVVEYVFMFLENISTFLKKDNRLLKKDKGVLKKGQHVSAYMPIMFSVHYSITKPIFFLLHLSFHLIKNTQSIKRLKLEPLPLTPVSTVSVSAILSCRPFFILIFLPCIKMNHYGFSRKGGWKDNDGMFLHHRNTHRQGVLTVNERRREKRIKTNAEVRSL